MNWLGKAQQVINQALVTAFQVKFHKSIIISMILFFSCVFVTICYYLFLSKLGQAGSQTHARRAPCLCSSLLLLLLLVLLLLRFSNWILLTFFSAKTSKKRFRIWMKRPGCWGVRSYLVSSDFFRAPRRPFPGNGGVPIFGSILSSIFFRGALSRGQFYDAIMGWNALGH